MSQPALRLVDKADMDKSKALDAALGQIEKNFGKGSIMKLGQQESAVELEAISTGSLGLDIALGIVGLWLAIGLVIGLGIGLGIGLDIGIDIGLGIAGLGVGINWS